MILFCVPNVRFSVCLVLPQRLVFYHVRCYVVLKFLPFESPELIDGDVIATERIVRHLAEEKLKGTDIRKLAYAFHYMLAKGVAEMAIAKAGDIKTAALSGGCYQNKLLTKLTANILEDHGFRVLLHSMVPPNDGGIALGQALYGINRINNLRRIYTCV